MTNNSTFNLNELIRRLKKIKAKEMMTKEVITVSKHDLLADVAEMMINKRISGFPVLENNQIIGTITADDLFMVMDMIKTGETIKNNHDHCSYSVQLAMSTEIITVSPSANLDEIIALMKYRNIHTLPVIFQNKLVGVIGRRDVFKYFYCTVKDICQDN